MSIWFLFIYGPGVEPSPLLLLPFIGLLIHPWMIDADDLRAISGMSDWQVKPKYSEKFFASAALTTTDPTRFDLGSNSGHRNALPMGKFDSFIGDKVAGEWS
jgi:hypothetical protein